MCGIAGIIDLSGQGRTVPADTIRAMADALFHRGPDEEASSNGPDWRSPRAA